MVIGLYFISEAIKRDHRELEECHRKLLESSNYEEQVERQRQFIWAWACHFLAKELVVCPLMNACSKRGKSLVDKDHEEHQMVHLTPAFGSATLHGR